MSYKSIGIDKSASFKRMTAFPLDELNYFEDYDKLLTAASSAKEAGSTETTYFFGQQVTYVKDGQVSTFVIVSGDSGPYLNQIVLSTDLVSSFISISNDLSTLSTSLSSISCDITSDISTISSDLSALSVSLSSISCNITSDISVISNDLSTLSISLSSISSDITSNISVISDDLSTLSVSLSGISCNITSDISTISSDLSVLSTSLSTISSNIILSSEISSFKFTHDITSTFEIGKYKLTDGKVVIPAKDKSITEVFEDMLVEEKIPEAKDLIYPYINITANEIKTYEVGQSIVSVSYNCSLYPGKYPYGPDTGITADWWTAYLNNYNTTKAWITTDNGTFNTSTTGYNTFFPYTFTDKDSLYLNVSVNYNDSEVCAYTNIGKSTNLKITERTMLSTYVATAVRYTYYGITTDKNDEIDSTLIRKLKNNTTKKLNGVELDVTDAMRVIIAIPQEKPSGAKGIYNTCNAEKLTKIIDVNASYENITNSFEKYTILVNDYSGSNPINYSVYMINFANQHDADKFIITQ